MPRSPLAVAIPFVCVCAHEVPRFSLDARYVFNGVLGCRDHATLCDRGARALARLAQRGIYAMADPQPAMHVVRRWRAGAVN